MGHFGWIDWSVIGLYLAGSTWLGAKLAGRQQTVRDFFLGGRRLPWTAIAGSIIASEVSGVTFVSVAANVFKPGGNFTYLQLILGSLLARAIIAAWIVPEYYRREVYSPYQYMGARLGPGVHRITTGLFFLGGFLAQGARLFLAALVLDAVTDIGIGPAILAMVAVSVAWTCMGGIATVIWTDVIQCVVLYVGALVTLVAVVVRVPGGAAEVVARGQAVEKFRVFDLSVDPTIAFTLWAGLAGMTFLTLASHATDQIMAQRIFCCRDLGAARKAVVASGVGQLLGVLMVLVGAALYAFYQHHPMHPDDAAKVASKVDYVLPVFILRELPMGVKGILFAAIFAAAASTGTSVLAAMGQAALASFYLPRFQTPPPQARQILVSRLFVAAAGGVLCATAFLCLAIRQYGDLLNLALAMAGYTYGPLLGILLMALRPGGRDARGLAWGVPASVLLVLALSWHHEAWARWTVLVASAILAVSAVPVFRREPGRLAVVVFVACGLVAVALHLPAYPKLAWPWHFPLGTALTFALGRILGRVQPPSER